MDLNYVEFYENRRSQIDARLNQIVGTPGCIEHYVHLHSDRIKYNHKKGASNSQIGWHRFENDEQLLVGQFIQISNPNFPAFLESSPLLFPSIPSRFVQTFVHRLSGNTKRFSGFDRLEWGDKEIGGKKH